MELPDWFVPLGQLVAALIVMKVVFDRYRAHRSANLVADAKGAGGGWSSVPDPHSNRTGLQGVYPQDTASETSGAPVAASRLARIHAARDEDAALYRISDLGGDTFKQIDFGH